MFPVRLENLPNIAVLHSVRHFLRQDQVGWARWVCLAWNTFTKVVSSIPTPITFPHTRIFAMRFCSKLRNVLHFAYDQCEVGGRAKWAHVRLVTQIVGSERLLGHTSRQYGRNEYSVF